MDDDDLSLRPLGADDDDWSLLARWLNEPHVREWWDPDSHPSTPQSVRAEYEQYTTPGSATTACIVELGDRPIGFIQFYPWASEHEYAESVHLDVADTEWGLDVLIGEPDVVGGGVGRRLVDRVSRLLIEEKGATAVVLVTEATNQRAQRAYEAADFRAAGHILDTDTRNGRRVRSLVMRRPAAPHADVSRPPRD